MGNFFTVVPSLLAGLKNLDQRWSKVVVLHIHKTHLPAAFQTTVLRGILRVNEGPSDLWCDCVCVYVWFPSLLLFPLWTQGEAPKQGSAQVEVMEGTGSDKMYREERGMGGWGREWPAQTNTLTRKPQQRETRSEQWQQESWAQCWTAGSTTQEIN